MGEIAQSARKAGRKPEEVQLLAVSKTVEAERIQQAIDAGLTAFGENRVQEWKEKYEILPKNISWHIIGRLQKNKIKYIINKIELLHSLCTLEAAQEIERLSAREGVQTNCLVQVNIGREESKAGVEQEELERFLASRVCASQSAGADGHCALCGKPGGHPPLFRSNAGAL